MKNLSFQFNFEQISLIEGDEYLISKCVGIIIENAIKFSPENEVVIIEFSKNKKNIILSVRDKGPGFSPKAMKNLFKLFSPGERHVDENEGIELALAKIIMEAHKGDILVLDNTAGALVQLCFLLPV
ncbi:MAG: sensor histidine kinase [Bacteroidales bacterium]|nr:sensor histidine kinase [Bacteroidales bacterium]